MSVLRSVEISFFSFLILFFFFIIRRSFILFFFFFFFFASSSFFLLDFFPFLLLSCLGFRFFFFWLLLFCFSEGSGRSFQTTPLVLRLIYIYIFLNLLFDVFVRVTFTFFPLFYSPNFLPTYLGNPSSSSHFNFSFSLSLFLFNFFHFFGGYHTPFFTLARSPPLQLGQCLRKRVSPLFLLSPLIYFLEELPKSTTTLNTHCSLKH